MQRPLGQKIASNCDLAALGHRRCRTISELILASGDRDNIEKGHAGALFAIAAAAIVEAWACSAQSGEDAAVPLARARSFYGVSYTPFRGARAPSGRRFPATPRRNRRGFGPAQAHPRTACDLLLDTRLNQICRTAKRHGIKVRKGCGCRTAPSAAAGTVTTAIAIGQAVSRGDAAVIVGNEFCCEAKWRRPTSCGPSARSSRRSPCRVSYADVWSSGAPPRT